MNDHKCDATQKVLITLLVSLFGAMILLIMTWPGNYWIDEHGVKHIRIRPPTNPNPPNTNVRWSKVVSESPAVGGVVSESRAGLGVSESRAVGGVSESPAVAPTIPSSLTKAPDIPSALTTAPAVPESLGGIPNRRYADEGGIPNQRYPEGGGKPDRR